MSTVSSSPIAGMVSFYSEGHLIPSAPPSSPISQRKSIEVASNYSVTTNVLRPDAASEEEPDFSTGSYEFVQPSARTTTELDLREKRIQMVLLLAIQGASRCPAKIKREGDRVLIDHRSWQFFWRCVTKDKKEDLNILEIAIPYALKMFPPKTNVKLWRYIKDGLNQLVIVYSSSKEPKKEDNSAKPAAMSESDAQHLLSKTKESGAETPEVKKNTMEVFLEELIQKVDNALPLVKSSLSQTEAKVAISEIGSHPHVLANIQISALSSELTEIAASAGKYTEDIHSLIAKIEQLKLPHRKVSGLSSELAKVWTSEFMDSFVKSLERIKGLHPSTHGDDIRKLTEALEVEMNIEAEKANRVAQAFMHNIWNS